MMRKIVLSLATLFGLSSQALAVCPSTFQIKDNAAVTGNVVYSDDGSNNCVPSVVIQFGANKTTVKAASTAAAAGDTSLVTNESPNSQLSTAVGAAGDSAWVSGSGSAIAILKNIAGGVASAIPAGSAIIGKVGIDQTTPGTTNLVAVTSSSVGAGATGSAAPANAVYNGTVQSGATGGQLKGLISCDNHVFKHITSATDTLAVQGVASQTIYVCGWRARAAGTATWYLENTASANANCVSTLTQLTGVATEAVNTGETLYNPIWGGLKNTSGNGLCINSTGTGGVDIDIWYTQF